MPVPRALAMAAAVGCLGLAEGAGSVVGGQLDLDSASLDLGEILLAIRWSIREI